MKQLILNTCIFLLLMGVNLLAQTFPDTLSRQFQNVLISILEIPGLSRNFSGCHHAR